MFSDFEKDFGDSQKKKENAQVVELKFRAVIKTTGRPRYR